MVWKQEKNTKIVLTTYITCVIMESALLWCNMLFFIYIVSISQLCEKEKSFL